MNRENESAVYSSKVDDVFFKDEDLKLFYPTPRDVRMFLQDEDFQEDFTIDGCFYPWELIRSLPLYGAENKRRGYHQFQSLIEKKRSRIERVKHETHANIRRIGTGMFSRDPISFRGDTFNLRKILEERENPFIEIGGPTFGWAFRNSPQPVVIANFYPYSGVEFIMDAEDMPFPDGSIGAIFESYVPAKLVDEAYRVLEPGGILVLTSSVLQRGDDKFHQLSK